MRIAIIGAGNMGSALARRLDPHRELVIASPRRATHERVAAAAPHARLTTSNVDAATDADVVVLAVKPWVVPEVMDEIAPCLRDGAMVVSLAAGVSLADMMTMIPANIAARVTVVRAMPNTAMSVGRSMTFLCSTAAAADIEPVRELFAMAGEVAVIEERLMGAATALCSCGIAYAMRYVRAMTQGALELGLYPDQARRYTLATMRGAIDLLEASGANPEVEIERVTTPGGITIRGLNAMEAHGFTTAVVEGIKASCK